MNNSKTAFVGLDVGGTNIVAGVVSEDSHLIGEIQMAKSPSDDTADAIISTFLSLIDRVNNTAERKGFIVKSCGVGIPDPFDYEKGISLMKHKFQGLYNINLKQVFEKKLEMPVYFLGDAQAFGLGVSWVEHPDKKRLLAITLGTGLGSGFIVECRIAHKEDMIPLNGQIWNLAFRNRLLEDFISKRAIENSYKNRSGESEEVRLIAELARKGNSSAAESFLELAQNLGEGLVSAAISFRPDIIVLGGKIGANAFDLFGKKAEEVFKQKSGVYVPFVPTMNEYLAIFGASYYAMSRESE